LAGYIPGYISVSEVDMRTEKLFQNRHSQSVHLPKGCKFEGNDVLVQKVEDSVNIFLMDKVWETFIHRFENFILVTNNKSEFSRIANLKIKYWKD
jgi:antitoxin VapB